MQKPDIYNIITVLSSVAAVLALVFQAADYQRNGAGSFRRVIGGMICSPRLRRRRRRVAAALQ
jgi:hypothetical protein